MVGNRRMVGIGLGGSDGGRGGRSLQRSKEASPRGGVHTREPIQVREPPDKRGITFRDPPDLSGVSPIRIGSLASALCRRLLVSSVISSGASSGSFDAQKNSLWSMRADSPWCLRSHGAPGARPPLRRYADLRGDRAAACRVPPLWRGEAGASRLAGRQSPLHETIRVLRRAALPRREYPRHCRGTAPGVAHGQGARGVRFACQCMGVGQTRSTRRRRDQDRLVRRDGARSTRRRRCSVSSRAACAWARSGREPCAPSPTSTWTRPASTAPSPPRARFSGSGADARTRERRIVTPWAAPPRDRITGAAGGRGRRAPPAGTP